MQKKISSSRFFQDPAQQNGQPKSNTKKSPRGKAATAGVFGDNDTVDREAERAAKLAYQGELKQQVCMRTPWRTVSSLIIFHCQSDLLVFQGAIRMTKKAFLFPWVEPDKDILCLS